VFRKLTPSVPPKFFLSKPTILKPGYASSWQETSNFNDLKRNNIHLFPSLSHLGCTIIDHLSFWGSISSKRLRATGLKCSVRGYFWSQLFRDHFYVIIVFRNLKKVGNHWSSVYTSSFYVLLKYCLELFSVFFFLSNKLKTSWGQKLTYTSFSLFLNFSGMEGEGVSEFPKIFFFFVLAGYISSFVFYFHYLCKAGTHSSKDRI
jgi:hypothetical protein